MSKKHDRRTVVKGAAWSIPVIAAATAIPQVTASSPIQQPEKTPVHCEYLQNNGHGGDPKNNWWHVTYSDGSSENLDNGTVQRNKTLKELCGKKQHTPK